LYSLVLPPFPRLAFSSTLPSSLSCPEYKSIDLKMTWYQLTGIQVTSIVLITRCENRSSNRPPNRETGLEIPCCPASDLLWVQITQSYPNRLRFSSIPCPQSPCHTEIDPVFKEGFFPR
jgi:hypothetical protein